MDLSKIISIAGKPGLFQIINQSRGGVIVTSLLDGKKMAIGQTQRVSALSEISMYTVEGDILLHDIFERVHKHTDGKIIEIDLKDDKEVRKFFTDVVPEHDDERVYHSDIRKLIKWYNTLAEKGLLVFEEETESVEEEAIEASAEEATVEKKAPKAAKPKASKKAADKPSAPEAPAEDKE